MKRLLSLLARLFLSEEFLLDMAGDSVCMLLYTERGISISTSSYSLSLFSRPHRILTVFSPLSFSSLISPRLLTLGVLVVDIEIMLLSLLVLDRVLDLDLTDPRLLVLESVGELSKPAAITGETLLVIRSLDTDWDPLLITGGGT